jgi:hypothetical protein
MISTFERELAAGWIYPCNLKDIEQVLQCLPASDVDGLWAVGLVPSTRKDSTANARYFPGAKPVIHIYSYPETLIYKLPAHVKHGDIVEGLKREVSYGMRIEQSRGHWMCRWSGGDLRAFILYHVLPHEIGHHVYHQQRALLGLHTKIGSRSGEQFAESYALRVSKVLAALSPR